MSDLQRSATAELCGTVEPVPRANTVANRNAQLGHLAIPFSIGTVIGEDPQPVNGSLRGAYRLFVEPPPNPVIKRVASPAAGMKL